MIKKLELIFLNISLKFYITVHLVKGSTIRNELVGWKKTYVGHLKKICIFNLIQLFYFDISSFEMLMFLVASHL